MGISIILGTNGFIMEKMSFGDTVCSESLLSAGSSGVYVRQGLELVSIRVSFRIFFFFPLCSHIACSKCYCLVMFIVNSFYHFVRKKGNNIMVSNEKLKY